MKTILSLLLYAIVTAAPGTAFGQSAENLSIVSRDGVSHDFTVELALSPAQQSKGLMNRTEMKPDHGMLFLFAGEEERSFWMKNTLIPLDILFLKKDGTIHHIHENARPLDLSPIPSNGPVTAVLELNGGVADKLGIVPGDKINHLFFKK